jgi:hypothetical protein
LAFLYELAVLGSPSDAQVADLEQRVRQAVHPLGMRLGHEIAWLVRPAQFNPEKQRAAAAIFFGAHGAPLANLEHLLRMGIPILPIVSQEGRVREEIPAILLPLNCLHYDVAGAPRTATAFLECVGLLPRQRRVFVSYRRDEARQAALQLFDAFASRLFDVFLDTHGIAPGDDFQAVLWHRLCDSDVLVMLDTPNYFASRWTSAEFGRALAKGIAVLQVGWPDSTPSARTATASRAELLPEEVDMATGRLADEAVMRICMQLETVRSQGHAIRNLNLVSNLRYSVEKIGGSVVGVGSHSAVYIKLADGRDIVAYPTVGVPTSTSLHDAVTNANGRMAAVVYDHIGLHPTWLGHLDWLGSHVRTARWVKATEAAWHFAGWEGS